MTDQPLVAVRIGQVSSTLTDLDAAPRQPDEDAPPARIVIDPDHRDALDGLTVGDHVLLLTWLQLADRATLRVHPRDDPTRPLLGVFATRSESRPNPIGVHEVTITALTGDGFQVSALEAIDGTPILDIKPTLGPPGLR